MNHMNIELFNLLTELNFTQGNNVLEIREELPIAVRGDLFNFRLRKIRKFLDKHNIIYRINNNKYLAHTEIVIVVPLLTKENLFKFLITLAKMIGE